jgi:hypothetical protein
LIGINKTKKLARSNSLLLSQQVYGKEHVCTHHLDTYYKPKYLKSVEDGKHVFGYPDGLPGGWCKHKKIHLVGHSQGG